MQFVFQPDNRLAHGLVNGLAGGGVAQPVEVDMVVGVAHHIPRPLLQQIP